MSTFVESFAESINDNLLCGVCNRVSVNPYGVIDSSQNDTLVCMRCFPCAQIKVNRLKEEERVEIIKFMSLHEEKYEKLCALEVQEHLSDWISLVNMMWDVNILRSRQDIITYLFAYLYVNCSRPLTDWHNLISYYNMSFHVISSLELVPSQLNENSVFVQFPNRSVIVTVNDEDKCVGVLTELFHPFENFKDPIVQDTLIILRLMETSI